MNNLETITINGEEYVKKSSFAPVETDRVIYAVGDNLDYSKGCDTNATLVELP